MYFSWSGNEFELAKDHFRHLAAICKAEVVHIVIYFKFYWVENFLLGSLCLT